MVRAAAVALIILLSGCYYSETDLVGSNARTITAIDNVIIAPRSGAYYIEGTGPEVKACYLQTKEHLRACSPAASVKLERTTFGNYIVQAFQNRRYHYGLWFRSDPSEGGRSGMQCFVWLGEDYVSPLVAGYIPPGPNMAAKLAIATKAKAVAPGPTINRTELLGLVALYERELSPITADEVTCISPKIMLSPERMKIAGDNRHIRDLD